jgi:hypothetical protein
MVEFKLNLSFTYEQGISIQVLYRIAEVKLLTKENEI